MYMAAEPPNEVRLNLRPPLDLAVTSRCAENNSRLNSPALGSRPVARHLTKWRPADLQLTCGLQKKTYKIETHLTWAKSPLHVVIATQRAVSQSLALAPPLRSQFAKTTTPCLTL